MPSIIDRITDAEAEAVAIKREAAAKAREAIAQAKVDAAQKLTQVREQGREAVNEAAQCAEKEGQETAAGIREDKAKEADALCDAARARVPDAVSFILERVVNA